ncbi:BREX-1 system adenine-specific DNA-methyltransferase PglX [Kaistella flava (ex Peng et al. 2021)]|uniref:site-specific DNA-methyltransferase (adenine-specific) n=1 Tax=Kaistella flava (ex Peng et al. 2021) TaxID=2038776 RepID=A0A7M2Y7Z7_9FLAO|nr:BREX-1 system adenine-specific DNA-methyltransferase PglX [Kaistella flava (ex Peng et al. 2021)]QOW09784.1 BREX-1 system adenine-specific DNA-methyltransferase PglX [Kaistella flava (ex Peng et al. 2021)]
MALTQGARNKIRSVVQSAKKLLMNEFESQLQQYYGIRPDGSYLLVEELTTRKASEIETARLLRQRLHYLEEGIAGTKKAPEAVRQLIREQAFTILNRFAAVRMSEERNIIRESIRKGFQSEGFLVYDQLTGGAKTADEFTRYTWYIGHVFDELAIDLPAVFDRFSPYALLFPSERVLLELLTIINDDELKMYRETGQQPVNLWIEDETIGWIYQYYNSREEISEMRDASGAPRNSRELAVRNQFFTPRYVVQFLVDNSLGRQWFEMTNGQTSLVDSCQYMVKREHEIFLKKGESIPETTIEGANYIEYRELKDPREILMLDPACGSMHFGLYCFDLYEQIYIEAWDNHPELMQDLRADYLREDFIKMIPGFILRYNIHGVDIDPRAIQIAGLSLWLRAQKTFDRLNLQPADRPAISKSNLVLAEPMPGDVHMLAEFTQSLPGPIGKLVRVIWDKMQLVGETGLLLKIEEELKKEIEITKAEYEKHKDSSAQLSIFDEGPELKMREMAAIYGKGQKISKDFFDTAEDEVLKALQRFSENAEGSDAFQKLLFAEDTARGFAFIELCRKRYDVIVMNPPFGAASKNSKKYIEDNYSLSKADLASVFIDRMLLMLSNDANLGSITTRTIFFLSTYSAWRRKYILEENQIQTMIDLGGGVLDAMVETSAYVIKKGKSTNKSIFFRLTDYQDKELNLKTVLLDSLSNNTYKLNPNLFLLLPNAPLCYWAINKAFDLSKDNPKISDTTASAKKGLDTGNNFRFIRNQWEIIEQNNWEFFILNEESTRIFGDYYTVINWKEKGKEVKVYGGNIRNEKEYFKEGLSWAFRSVYFKPHIIPKGFIPTSSKSLMVFSHADDISVICGLFNSQLYDYIIKLNLEKDYQPAYNNGTVNNLPIPHLNAVLVNAIKQIVLTNYEKLKYVKALDSKSVNFKFNTFVNKKSISIFLQNITEKLQNYRDQYVSDLSELNSLVFNYFQITELERDAILRIVLKAGEDDEGKIFQIDKKSQFDKILTILVGSAFGRWDIRILKHWDQEWSDEDIFKARKHSPFLYGKRESTLDLVLPEYHDKIKEIWEIPYPIKVLEEVATVSDINPIVGKLKEVIQYFWPETHGTIEEELTEHFKVNELSEIFDKHSKFFEAHLKDYSRNKRVSPIYWHLGVPSGKFNVWVYYPKLNAGSLFKIINELVDPKIKEVAKEVEGLEFNGTGKELNDQKLFLAELEDFKEELLRVAQLPYQPNQDDGVLITAAPLHNLFRHPKWKKATQDCWKQLEKGDYDWAHLAYSIWPDRVRKKCVKDLSMAIAHGLEDICTVKPKETKGKIVK